MFKFSPKNVLIKLQQCVLCKPAIRGLHAICAIVMLSPFASGLYYCNLRRCSRIQNELHDVPVLLDELKYIYISTNMILGPCLAILNTRFIYRVSCRTWYMGCT